MSSSATQRLAQYAHIHVLHERGAEKEASPRQFAVIPSPSPKSSSNDKEPPKPYFTVHLRGHTNVHYHSLDLALPSETHLTSDTDSVEASSQDVIPMTPTTRELAAGKGKLPHFRTNVLRGSADGSCVSSTNSLTPSTPRAVSRTHRTSAWSKPTSIFGNYAVGAERPMLMLTPSAASAAEYDNAHLQLGANLDLMPHGKTLELYMHNARKAQDPQTVYEKFVFILEAAQERDDISVQGHQASMREAMGMLHKIADRGHVGAQFYLAECLAAGVGQPDKKARMHQAHPLYVLAAKHGHADAAFKAGRCYEHGWGCIKDHRKALNWLRKAGSQGHPGALYRLGMAELNGGLERRANSREGVKYLKLSARVATPEWPQALHELALLHNRGIEGVVFRDEDYACELLIRAAELGFAPSAYLMGQKYEYGWMGCPVDGGLSVHMYNIAAQQDHKEACFSLCAWNMVGVPGILAQNDTEALLWAQKAAIQNFTKAEYAMGYFCKVGIGIEVDKPMARIFGTSAPWSTAKTVAALI